MAAGQFEDRCMSARWVADGRGDFDFLTGRWRVEHRRLRHRLAGDETWDEFAGECECRALLEGLVNVDDNYLGLPTGGYRAVSLRRFHPASRLWSIWWIDGRAMRLEPPVHGRFARGVGTFIGDDAHDGRAVRVRYLWTQTATGSPR
jgi:hypothetical protein